MNKLLVIGYIWPEENKTAASYRLLQIIDLFIEQEITVIFTSAARVKKTSSQALVYRGVSMKSIALNDDSFDRLLQQQRPDAVLYDRFIMEEQYGWRVRQILPQALTILDTEDLHFLREARRAIIENGSSLEYGCNNENALREISSIQRCDVSLIISQVEYQLLINQYHIARERLFYMPFLLDKRSLTNYAKNPLPYHSRKGFCTIGNLKHAPNLDAVRMLNQKIWPLIRKQLPQAQLYVYGAHAPKEILEMHDPSTGFIVKGHAPSVDQVLSAHRLLLAPLRYGAGIKGKIFDSMKNGLPVVMTTIASEAMFPNEKFCGPVVDDFNEFALAAIDLYENLLSWEKFQNNGFETLRSAYEKSAFAKAFFQHIEAKNWTRLKERSFTEKTLLLHADAHYKYLSYWIKVKRAT